MGRIDVVEADLTWFDGEFRSGIKITVGGDGRIVTVGEGPRQTTVRLADRALLPGFVNAHSHAFQRALRGLGETFPAEAGSFWTWREAMYELVQHIDPRRFRQVCQHTFREMLASGITSVGEFHYLHHMGDTRDFAFDDMVLEAADAAGIRIVLLNTYYETGDVKEPLSPAQRRFHTPTPVAFWENVERLHGRLRSDAQSLGVAAHSIRAVPIATVCAIHDEATKRGIPFHMHVEEQRREIETCERAYGTTPMDLLNKELQLPGNFTAVHCTHSRSADLEKFLDAQRGICLCPLTEANLGDGIPRSDVYRAQANLSLGTDSNARISMPEEMRWLEYGQRLRYEKRGAVADQLGDVARRIIDIATAGGALALGLETGSLRPGAYADLISLDLNHPSLRFADVDSLAAAFVFGCSEDVIDGVCVGGDWKQTKQPPHESS